MTAEEFGKYINELRQKRNMTTRQLEIKSGVSNSYISQIENGKRGIPKPDILYKLAPALNVSYEKLMIAAGYLSLNEKDPLYPNIHEIDEMYRVPVVGKIPAGQPCLAVQDTEDFEDIPRSWLNGHPEEYFILDVFGDSMEGAKIFDGDRALIHQQPDFISGQICAVGIIEDEPDQYATLKYVYDIDEKFVELVPDNPKYPRRKISRNKICIYGILKKIIRDY